MPVRPNKEYPQSLDEIEVILTAVRLVDVYEIRRWITRGHDINVKISTPLIEELVRNFDFSKEQHEKGNKKENASKGAW